jgi:hypothetical protein
LNPAERILRTLGRHLEGPAQVRLLGGAALILGYGLDRATEDVDLLVEERELELLVAEANPLRGDDESVGSTFIVSRPRPGRTWDIILRIEHAFSPVAGDARGSGEPDEAGYARA